MYTMTAIQENWSSLLYYLMHEIRCRRIRISGLVYQGMNFAMPFDFAPVAISAIPTEDLWEINNYFIESRSQEMPYEILEERSEMEMTSLLKTMNMRHSAQVDAEVC